RPGVSLMVLSKSCCVPEGQRSASLFRRRAIGIVADAGGKQGIAHILVMADGVQETLAGHISVIKTRDAVRSHDALHQTVIVVDLFFDIALLILWVAPRETLLNWQMGGRINKKRHRLIARVHDGYLFRLLLLGNRRPVIEERDAGLVKPPAKHPIQRVLAAAEVIGHAGRVLGSR